ncbi:pulmonary surfactant-associated protein D-like [Xenopus laevis]|uniref:Pulmonary surfactant-associated protein D-like n=1 Tax=Xenopus laevis TaxID=8355 RepID=A0A8J1LDL9_XENLA|nr:pulmonary surfactant-associated protein D-like [Xenopus laevis]
MRYCLQIIAVITAVFLPLFSKAGSETPASCSVAQGLPGLNGRDGRDGANGPKGDAGSQGLPGDPGTPGLRGNTGPPGKVGPKGNQGDKGEKGFPAMPGLKGNAGPQGVPGPKGEKGYSDSIIETLRAKVNSMEAELRNLKLNLAIQKKALVFSKGASAGEKLYATRGEEATYEDAMSTCSKAGGQLPSPRNDAENKAVFSLSLLYNKALVLGIHDKQKEGTFTYSNNDKIGFSNWKPGEPNDHNGMEDCVQMLIDGTWNDIRCELKHLTVCEFA